MKPYGIRSKFRYNYKNYNPKKGWKNWWEVELNVVKSKKSDRQKNKRLLKNIVKSLKFKK